ncbi:kinase-like domain-containing protein [Rhizophagus irregularis DAOM 181602=DAOM 197198]|nr:kinase-like domain-containing protein [Rhizophagus irregularis DAOM 181602=DAOM 197198]
MNTDNDPFDPTPNLKSSPVPVLFIPFKNNEDKCNCCGTEYSKSLKYDQKYCKVCLFWHIQYITGNNTYLDVLISTNNSQCIKHKATRNDFYTTNIQEWCEYCSEILYFTQVVARNTNCRHTNYICCKRCYYESQLPDYQISSGWVKSTLNKKSIPILYLPWWDSYNHCIVCYKELKYIHQESKSYCQKWCLHCHIIYTGCRSGNYIIEEFLVSTRIQNHNFHSIANYMYNMTTYNPTTVYLYISDKLRSPARKIEWIPYSHITNLKKMAEGGFSIIYKATWEGTDVAVKKLHDSQNISKYFLNELRSLYQCNDDNFGVIGYYGITQDPITKEYMIILNYAKGGNLHNYLQKNFINITWNNKLLILQRISFGLYSIHYKNFIHRDFHSGNMLLSTYWKVGDLGLSQPANNTLSNNEIYGVIPYIAPEIFKGAAFSKESDVYSFEDTPECYADLMKKCWDSNPSKRPIINEIYNTLYTAIWYQFEQAEKKRLELIQLKKLGPEFSEKPHPKAIYTSRALSDLISKASTIGSMVSLHMKQEYITQEYEFDIDNIQRLSIQNTNSATQSLIVPVNSSRKRNFEELKNETNENQKNRKYIKVDNLNDELLNIIELI